VKFRDDPHGDSNLAPGEFRVLCPLCGSPHVCQTEDGDPKYSGPAEHAWLDTRRLYDRKTLEAKPFTVTIERSVPHFTCLAGDCGYVGWASRP
jgi:hypothetical protein